MSGRATFKEIAQEAILAYRLRDYRLATTKYFEAFHACPDRWMEVRWQFFQIYTKILLQELFEASLEHDITPLKVVKDDKKELKLYRIQAAYTTAILLNDSKKNEEEAADCLREAINLAEKMPKQEKRHKVLTALLNATGEQTGMELKRVEDILPAIVDECKRCFQTLISKGKHTYAAVPSEMFGGQGIYIPPELTPSEWDRLFTVGGELCDCCGKSREEVGRTLLDVCSNCKKAYYCGRECQRKQWKAGHKQWCRKPGEIKAGDFVKLYGLQSKPELNDMVVKVVGEDPKTKGRWEVELQGGTKSISVASEKMHQLRPPK